MQSIFQVNRRGFLGSTMAGLAAIGFGTSSGLTGSNNVCGDDAGKLGPGPENLFLTWQRDPTTSMTIQWIGPNHTNVPNVQYRLSSDQVWQLGKVRTKPFPGTDLKVFRCELTGLTPGSDYAFRIDNTLEELKFRTMPAKATDEFWFVTGGDAGTGSAAVASNELAAKQDPYFVVIGGDVAYDNGKSPKTFNQFLQNYRRTMIDSQGRLIPLVTCPGNHEVDGSQADKRVGAGSYLSVFDCLFADKTYEVLDFGDYLSLVLLDTNHICSVSGDQTSWLQKVLSEREDHPHVFVVNHVPAYPSVRAPWGSDPEKRYTGEDQRKHWCPLFERYKVNVVLEHHDHAFKRTHPLTDGVVDYQAGVHYLGDGSWGKIRPPAGLQERPYLVKTSGEYHISLHRLQGERRFHIALTGTGKVADVLTTEKNRPSI